MTLGLILAIGGIILGFLGFVGFFISAVVVTSNQDEIKGYIGIFLSILSVPLGGALFYIGLVLMGFNFAQSLIK